MRALVLSILSGLAAGSLSAQATITGRIVNDSTKEPIAAAEILLEETGKKSLSDQQGRFVLTEVPTGIGYATIRKIGFRPVRLKALIFGRDSLDIEVGLSPAVVELDPIEVTASSVPPGMEDFARRRLGGWGDFIDASTLRQSESRLLADLLRSVRGIRIMQAGATKHIAATSRAGRTCPMAVWLDGARIYSPGRGGGLVPDLNDFPISQLEGVEIYRGGAETPAEFAGSGSGCGTLVLWTRRQ